MELIEESEGDLTGMSKRETEGKSFEMNGSGNFRIVVKGQYSNWVSYSEIATLEVDGRLYIGVSDYHGGYLPTECALLVQKVDEEGIPGFVNVKIFDLIRDIYLDKDEILELLNESLFQDEYYSETKKGIDNHVKLKIINLEVDNKPLSPNEIKDIFEKILPIDEFRYQIEGI